MIPHHTLDGPEDAATVVLSNSLGTTLDMWRPQVNALSDRFRLIRHDTRGHGRTPAGCAAFSVGDLADDIADLLDHLDAERAHLVGVSLGGATALEFAVRHPDRVGRLAAICTAARIATPAYWAERVRQVRTRSMTALADAAMERWFTTEYRAEHPDVVKRFRADFANTDPLGYAACCRAIGDMDLRDRLALVRSPTLVMYGTEDEITTDAHSEVLRQCVPLCETVAIPGAKHLAATEQSAFVNRRLIEHLTK